MWDIRRNVHTDQLPEKAVIFFEDFDRLPDWRTRYFEYAPEKGSFWGSASVWSFCWRR